MDRPITDALAAVPLFASLDRGALEELARAAETCPIAAGEFVLREGDAGDALFVVESGGFEVLSNNRRTRVLRAGDVFGELAVLGNRPRNASVRAIRDGAVWRIDATAFAAVLATSPGLARGLVEALTRLVFESAPFGTGAPAADPVVALAAVHPGVPIPAIVAAFRAAAGADRVCIVDRETAGADPTQWGLRIEASERADALVLLLAGPERDEWFEFCCREADRIVAVADVNRAAPALAATTRLDLALCGTPRAHAVTRALSAHESRAHHLIGADDPEGVARMVRRITRRSIGLVLSGGGARGVAHIGALQVLAERGVVIDRFGGTSMGALVGALAASGLTPTAIEARLPRVELAERKPFADYALPRVALFRARRARSMLERLLGPTSIEETPCDFFCVSADLVAAGPVVHRRGSVVLAVGASMSLPGLAPPVIDGDRVLVDGGVLDNLPIETMVAADEGSVVAVDVMGRGTAGGTTPTLVETVARSMTLASRRRAEEQHVLADTIVTPELAGIGLLDFRRFDEIVAAGRTATEYALENSGQ